MYTLAVKKDFTAYHYLIGGDWGPENTKHSHDYILEIQLQGDSLDQHGFLVDIVDVEHQLGLLVQYYENKTLNDLPEFSGKNPSIEHFARIFCQQFYRAIQAQNLSSVTVKIWENDIAWTSYQLRINPQNL